ncbi:hypothetical protein ISCGN_023417 [Ixodes scapularis]
MEWVPSVAVVPVEALPEDIGLPLVASYLLAFAESGLMLSIFESTKLLRGTRGLPKEPEVVPKEPEVLREDLGSLREDVGFFWFRKNEDFHYLPENLPFDLCPYVIYWSKSIVDGRVRSRVPSPERLYGISELKNTSDRLSGGQTRVLMALGGYPKKSPQFSRLGRDSVAMETLVADIVMMMVDLRLDGLAIHSVLPAGACQPSDVIYTLSVGGFERLEELLGNLQWPPGRRDLQSRVVLPRRGSGCPVLLLVRTAEYNEIPESGPSSIQHSARIREARRLSWGVADKGHPDQACIVRAVRCATDDPCRTALHTFEPFPEVLLGRGPCRQAILQSRVGSTRAV